jgi:hypothetical protein
MKQKRTIFTNKWFVLFCMMLFLGFETYAQFKMESLTGNGRPTLEHPEQFVAEIKQKANKIIMDRIGEAKFYEWVDTAFRYPHYYDNVYFNNAPGEKNYRVFYRMRPNAAQVFEIELSFRQITLTLISPIEDLLPDCRLHPRRCSLLDNETIKSIAQQEMQYLKNVEGFTHFGYDLNHHRFVWTYAAQKMKQYPKGEKEEIILDASSGKILNRSFVPDYYMGR